MRQAEFEREIQRRLEGLSKEELEEITADRESEGDGELPPGQSQESETATIVFPEAAWTGLFGHWRDTVTPCTEAALETLWAAFLVAVGLMLGRNVWKNSPRPLYPNFYVLLLGQTGDSRKSTVLWLAAELLRHIGEDDVEILTGIVSSEGIFERLAKAEGTRALGYADEFRALLSVARRKVTADIIPKLNSLYYCPDREGIDRRQKSTTVIRPFFSLITATPREYVEDLLTNLDIVGGMLNRFLIVTGEEQPPKPDVEPPSPAAWENLAIPLRQIRDAYIVKPRRMEWYPDAKELWVEFYVEWKKNRKGLTARTANLSARTFEHILKIAIVYSVLAEEERISSRSLAIAIAIGEWLEKTSLRLFGDVGMDPFTKTENIILARLRTRGGREYTRNLQQWLSPKGVNGKQFRDVIKVLFQNGHITFGEESTLAGRKRPYVEEA